MAPFNLGGNVFGWTLNEKQSFEILDAYTAAGFDFIDTADSYSHWVDGGAGGQSETIIGNWLKSRGSRSDVVIATKVGGATGVHGIDISRKHILETAEASLRRLQTDYIDLYYTHYDDEQTPITETLDAYETLIRAGKVRYIAASNLSPERLKESLVIAEQNSLPKYQALQPLYNLVERKSYETGYAPVVDQYGLTVFPYYALASGFLTGKYRSEGDFKKSVRGEGAGKYLHDQGLQLLQTLDDIAAKHQTVPATVALAWLSAQPHIGGPLASATSREQLDQLLAAASLTLDTDDLQQLDAASKWA